MSENLEERPEDAAHRFARRVIDLEDRVATAEQERDEALLEVRLAKAALDLLGVDTTKLHVSQEASDE